MNACKVKHFPLFSNRISAHTMYHSYIYIKRNDHNVYTNVLFVQTRKSKTKIRVNDSKIFQVIFST